jgi:hypothetical protein
VYFAYDDDIMRGFHYHFEWWCSRYTQYFAAVRFELFISNSQPCPQAHDLVSFHHSRFPFRPLFGR